MPQSFPNGDMFDQVQGGGHLLLLIFWSLPWITTSNIECSLFSHAMVSHGKLKFFQEVHDQHTRGDSYNNFTSK
jgi:hypothetical protein